MNQKKVDLVIVGAGPVGLMCAYLSHLCGLTSVTIDKSAAPLEVGRADALNARTLQLLEIAKVFNEIYPFGKTCNTSSVWKDGKFISRQSSWWENLEGCLHKHFLMIGQPFIEKLLDAKISKVGAPVMRSSTVSHIEVKDDECLTTLSDGEVLRSSFVIGCDGAHSLVRSHFKIPFEIVRPRITWAVIDGVIESDFPKVPEIIAFQTETSDVAWIPREGDLDRFYVRMDDEDFSMEEAIQKINRAMQPHRLTFKKVKWFSHFSVKESVAESFSVQNRVFLAGDSCHVHSVNGGQGLNTGLADAFNLIWKLKFHLKYGASEELVKSYERERKPVAQSVIESSGELVRSTKYSDSGTHALDYVRIVEKRAGNITGMGIRYGDSGEVGTRLLDEETFCGDQRTRLYSLLKYSCFTLLVFGEFTIGVDLPELVHVVQISPKRTQSIFWKQDSQYSGKYILVRPDSYIQHIGLLSDFGNQKVLGKLSEVLGIKIP